jgi:hypothetical protein
LDGAIDFRNVAAHDWAGLRIPWSRPVAESFGSSQAATDLFARFFDFVGVEEFVVLKGVSNGVVINLHIGPMSLCEAIGGSAKIGEGLAKAIEALLKFAAISFGDDNTWRRNRSNLFGDVVGCSVGINRKGDEK